MYYTRTCRLAENLWDRILLHYLRKDSHSSNEATLWSDQTLLHTREWVSSKLPPKSAIMQLVASKSITPRQRAPHPSVSRERINLRFTLYTGSRTSSWTEKHIIYYCFRVFAPLPPPPLGPPPPPKLLLPPIGAGHLGSGCCDCCGCCPFRIATFAARIAPRRSVFAGGSGYRNVANIDSSAARRAEACACTGEGAGAGAGIIGRVGADIHGRKRGSEGNGGRWGRRHRRGRTRLGCLLLLCPVAG